LRRKRDVKKNDEDVQELLSGKEDEEEFIDDNPNLKNSKIF